MPERVDQLQANISPNREAPKWEKLRCRKTGRRKQRKQKILLIDDSPATLSAVACVLADEGYQVETVSDGTAGIEALTREDFDLLITDINMRPPGAPRLSALRNIFPTKTS